ncbi:O-antigen ligase [Geomicrobium sediminis]|uniref:O-antigen ligase n=1 Tax=Geomicrobium sediminis TaxID=1347788 RepID=A0ABS2P9B8_9BACL|nr:O-antigen ligase [Geomicrobium sediminis]
MQIVIDVTITLLYFLFSIFIVKTTIKLIRVKGWPLELPYLFGWLASVIFSTVAYIAYEVTLNQIYTAGTLLLVGLIVSSVASLRFLFLVFLRIFGSEKYDKYIKRLEESSHN